MIKDRGKNGLDISKFHLLLQFVRNICRLRAVPQYHGSTLESSAKYLAKCPGLRTPEYHKSIYIQTDIRYHEYLTILECKRIYHADSECQICLVKCKNEEPYPI